MPRVLNKRTDTIPPDAVYVGMPSKWGNPFRITANRTREEAVEGFRALMEAAGTPEILGVEELRGKDLVCWCAPKACHADVLLELANA